MLNWNASLFLYNKTFYRGQNLKLAWSHVHSFCFKFVYLFLSHTILKVKFSIKCFSKFFKIKNFIYLYALGHMLKCLIIYHIKTFRFNLEKLNGYLLKFWLIFDWGKYFSYTKVNLYIHLYIPITVKNIFICILMYAITKKLVNGKNFDIFYHIN